MSEPVIAMIFDFDDTLAPDSISHLLRRELRFTDEQVKAFWDETTALVTDGWDPPIAYLSQLLDLVRHRRLSLTKAKLRSIGAELKPFDGLPELFPQLRDMVNRKKEFVDAGVRFQFYVISGGLEEVIRGNPIRDEMAGIFGCTFRHDKETDEPTEIRSAISFTEKTRFLFGIHKGFSERELRATPYVVNDAMKNERPTDRPIPLDQMIYLGDGPSDIPCFSVVKEGEGNAIGIRKPRGDEGKISKGFEMARGERTTQGPYKADYRPGTDMREAIEDSILDIAYKIVVRRRERRVEGPSFD